MLKQPKLIPPVNIFFTLQFSILKKIFLLLFFLIYFSFLNAQVNNPDTMIHRIFMTLQKNDLKAFTKLFPNMQQMKAVMRKMIAESKSRVRSVMDSSAIHRIENLTEADYKKGMQAQFAGNF